MPPKKKRARRSGLEKILAPRVGFEPTTLRLTAGCSAVELPRNVVPFVGAIDNYTQITIYCNTLF